MDSDEARTLHPREVLRQVANSMNWQYNELSVTLPAQTTWRATIRAAETASAILISRCVQCPAQLGSVKYLGRWRASRLWTYPQKVSTWRRSNRGRLWARQLASVSARWLKRLLIQNSGILRPKLGEGYLPILRANFVLQGVDRNVPTVKMPNERVGVLFGHPRALIDLAFAVYLSWYCTTSTGEKISVETWGRIVVEECLSIMRLSLSKESSARYATRLPVRSGT